MRKELTVPIVLAALVLIALPSSAYALSPYQSGWQHGISDAKKAIQGRTDWYIDQPGKFFTEHTGQFTQGYVDGFNSVPGIPKDYKAGYQNGTNYPLVNML